MLVYTLKLMKLRPDEREATIDQIVAARSRRL